MLTPSFASARAAGFVKQPCRSSSERLHDEGDWNANDAIEAMKLPQGDPPPD